MMKVLHYWSNIKLNSFTQWQMVNLQTVKSTEMPAELFDAICKHVMKETSFDYRLVALSEEVLSERVTSQPVVKK